VTGPSQSTVKALFAVSRNQCAFPGCDAAMVVFSEHPTILGEICHIRGRRPGAKRYDRTQTDAERHGFGNLLLLCGYHHTWVDADDKQFTVERLTQIKAEHEAASASPIGLPDDVIEHWLAIGHESALVFSRRFNFYVDQLGVTRGHVADIVRRPDKSQLLMTDNGGLQHLYFLRRGTPHWYLVYATRLHGRLTIEWVLKTREDAHSVQASPVEVLEQICMQVGNDITIRGQQRRFFQRLILPATPGERPPAPERTPETPHASWVWALWPTPVYHWEIRNAHSISFERLRNWLRS
jgi:hypothetical protein